MKTVEFKPIEGEILELPVKEAVLKEVKCEGSIVGGRPAYKEIYDKEYDEALAKKSKAANE